MCTALISMGIGTGGGPLVNMVESILFQKLWRESLSRKLINSVSIRVLSKLQHCYSTIKCAIDISRGPHKPQHLHSEHPTESPVDYINFTPVTRPNQSNSFQSTTVSNQTVLLQYSINACLVRHECRLTHMFVFATQRGQHMLTKRKAVGQPPYYITNDVTINVLQVNNVAPKSRAKRCHIT
jgi:hypothetical protein